MEKLGSLSDAETDMAIGAEMERQGVQVSILHRGSTHSATAPPTPLKVPGKPTSLPDPEGVLELQEQLHEKDRKLTDVRLEALSAAHQLEQLRDTMTRMKVSRSRLLMFNVVTLRLS